MTQKPSTNQQFYLTAPSPCPYLPGQFERKMFTHLVGNRASELNDILTQGGFRRSQNISYRPACESCRACISVRVVVDKFKPSKNLRRVAAANRDIISTELTTSPTAEQYEIFRDYLDSRHPNGGMSDMGIFDYAMMVEDTHVDSVVIEYRQQEAGGVPGLGIQRSPLLATALTDYLSDGLSMLYSFFDTDWKYRSLGTFMILDHIERARKANMQYVYLGYWVSGSPRMDYKIRFQPLEYLGSNGWTPFTSKDKIE